MLWCRGFFAGVSFALLVSFICTVQKGAGSETWHPLYALKTQSTPESAGLEELKDKLQQVARTAGWTSTPSPFTAHPSPALSAAGLEEEWRGPAFSVLVVSKWKTGQSSSVIIEEKKPITADRTFVQVNLEAVKGGDSRTAFFVSNQRNEPVPENVVILRTSVLKRILTESEQEGTVPAGTVDRIWRKDLAGFDVTGPHAVQALSLGVVKDILSSNKAVLLKRKAAGKAQGSLKLTLEVAKKRGEKDWENGESVVLFNTDGNGVERWHPFAQVAVSRTGGNNSARLEFYAPKDVLILPEAKLLRNSADRGFPPASGLEESAEMLSADLIDLLRVPGERGPRKAEFFDASGASLGTADLPLPEREHERVWKWIGAVAGSKRRVLTETQNGRLSVRPVPSTGLEENWVVRPSEGHRFPLAEVDGAQQAVDQGILAAVRSGKGDPAGILSSLVNRIQRDDFGATLNPRERALLEAIQNLARQHSNNEHDRLDLMHRLLGYVRGASVVPATGLEENILLTDGWLGGVVEKIQRGQILTVKGGKTVLSGPMLIPTAVLEEARQVVVGGWFREVLTGTQLELFPPEPIGRSAGGPHPPTSAAGLEELRPREVGVAERFRQWDILVNRTTGNRQYRVTADQQGAIGAVQVEPLIEGFKAGRFPAAQFRAGYWLLRPSEHPSILPLIVEGAEGKIFNGLQGPLMRVTAPRDPKRRHLMAVASGSKAYLFNWEDGVRVQPDVTFDEQVLTATLSASQVALLGVVPSGAQKRSTHYPEHRIGDLFRFTYRLPAAERLYPHSLAYAPDRKRLLVTGVELETARIQNLEPKDEGKYAGTHGLVATIRPMEGRPVSGAYHPDSKEEIVALGTDLGTVEVWRFSRDPDSGSRPELLARGVEHGGAVLVPFFSPDGRLLATGDASGNVRLWNWDSRTHQLTSRFFFPTQPWKRIFTLSFLPTNPQIVSAAGEDGAVRFWDAVAGQQLARVEPHNPVPIRSMTFAPDGSKILVGRSGLGRRDHSLALWKVPAVVSQWVTPAPSAEEIGQGEGVAVSAGLEEEQILSKEDAARYILHQAMAGTIDKVVYTDAEGQEVTHPVREIRDAGHVTAAVNQIKGDQAKVVIDPEKQQARLEPVVYPSYDGPSAGLEEVELKRVVVVGRGDQEQLTAGMRSAVIEWGQGRGAEIGLTAVANPGRVDWLIEKEPQLVLVTMNVGEVSQDSAVAAAIAQFEQAGIQIRYVSDPDDIPALLEEFIAPDTDTIERVASQEANAFLAPFRQGGRNVSVSEALEAARSAFSARPRLDSILIVGNQEGAESELAVGTYSSEDALADASETEIRRLFEAREAPSALYLVRIDGRQMVIAQPVHVVLSSGYTKVAVGVNDAKGLIGDPAKQPAPLVWDELRDVDLQKQPLARTLDALVDQVTAVLAFHGVDPRRLEQVGISTAGIGDFPAGVIAMPKLAEHGLAERIALKAMLKVRLKQEFGRPIPVSLVNDGGAAVLGEHNLPEGALRDVQEGMAVILGGGVGSGEMENGEVVYAVPGVLDAFLNEIGWHLVTTDGGQTWEYQGDGANLESEIPRPAQAGEWALEQHMAGPWLAARAVEWMRDRGRADEELFGEKIPIQQDELPPLLSRNHRPVVPDLEMQTPVLQKMTDLGQQGDADANAFIEESGRSFGAALRTFRERFQDRAFAQGRIALVSTIGEKFGAGGKDRFLAAVRKAVGTDDVVRSRTDVKREWAFSMPKRTAAGLEEMKLIFTPDNAELVLALPPQEQIPVRVVTAGLEERMRLFEMRPDLAGVFIQADEVGGVEAAVELARRQLPGAQVVNLKLHRNDPRILLQQVAGWLGHYGLATTGLEEEVVRAVQAGTEA